MDYWNEYEDALAQDAMTQGEWASMAVNQYAAAYGAEDRDSAWILSPFDTWERNPFYKGPPQPHPEDDGDDIELPEPVIPDYGTDEIPF